MTNELILYRFSGWLVTGICIYLAIYAKGLGHIWRGRFVYVISMLIWVAVCFTLSSITALFLKNNLFVEYFYLPVMFVFKGLYLRDLQVNKYVKWVINFGIISYVFISIYNILDFKNLLIFNSIGSILNSSFFLLLSFFTLTFFFRGRKLDKRLRINPDFWFVATIFCFAFLGLISSVITDVTYKAGNNDKVLYAIFISENFVDCLVYYGYYKGLQLLNTKL